MKQAIVVYDSVYGNTEAVARAIAEGLGTEGRIEARVARVDAIRPESVAANDIIVLGSPNHMGAPTRAVKKIIRRLRKMDLAGKRIAVFDTCFEPERGKATGKMKERIARDFPGAHVVTPGLSAIVTGMKGPLKDGELARSREFGARVLADATG
jgi:flavodoxin